VRLRALGQQLLRACATWVRDQADRVLIRVGAESAMQEREGAPADAPDVDPSAQAPDAGDGAPGHWRRLVDTGPPRDWLARVEAARGRFATIEFDAGAPALVDRPSPAPVEAMEYPPSVVDRQPPVVGPPPDRPGVEPPYAESGTQRRPETHDVRPLAKAPRAAPPADTRRQLESPTPERAPLATAPEKSLERPPASRALDDRVDTAAPLTTARSTPQPEVERRVRPPVGREPTAPFEASPWRTAPSETGVKATSPRQVQRPEARAPIWPAADPAVARRAQSHAPLNVERRTTSADAGSPVWPELPLPAGRSDRDGGLEPAESARPRPHVIDWNPLPRSAPATSLPQTTDIRRSTAAPAFFTDATPVARAQGGPEETAFSPDDPGHRWPELPDTTPPVGREDWLELRRRLDRVARLDREQRGW
jgi:hypothetical protein